MVILGLFLVIRENGIRLIDFLELFLGRRIARVDIGMILLRQLVLCFFDGRSVGVFIHAEHFIIISFIRHSFPHMQRTRRIVLQREKSEPTGGSGFFALLYLSVLSSKSAL